MAVPGIDEYQAEPLTGVQEFAAERFVARIRFDAEVDEFAIGKLGRASLHESYAARETALIDERIGIARGGEHISR